MAAAAAAAATGAFGTGTFGLVFPGRSYAVAPGGPLLRAADASGARFVLDMGECGVPADSASAAVPTACVFLSDASTLPAGSDLALSLYVQSPGTEWEWRGAVTADAPSKLIQLRWPPADWTRAPQGTSCKLGLTLEPRGSGPDAQASAAGADAREAARQAGQVQFARQVGIDLLRYVSSFMGDGAQVGALLERWWARFETKYQRDPHFLASQSLD